MKAFLLFLSFLIILTFSWQADAKKESYIEYAADTEQLCKENGGCVVIPKVFLTRVQQMLYDQQKMISDQYDSIINLRGKLNKSCA